MPGKFIARRICAVAVVLFGFEAAFVDALAASPADDKALAKQKGCEYQPSDDDGRCPVLTYKVVMRQDEAVCNRIAASLNHAPAGPGKLYSDPIFVPWRIEHHAHDPGRQSFKTLTGETWFKTVLWVVAPVFNDGRQFAVYLADREIPDHGHGDFLVLFTDPSGFERFLTNGGDSGPGWYPNPISESTSAPSDLTLGFPLLPQKYRQSQRWAAAGALRATVGEFHLVSLDGTIYLVARVYYQEIIYVMKFQPDRSSDVCYLAADRWFEAHINRKLTEHKGED
jgi:hypothetical protein